MLSAIYIFLKNIFHATFISFHKTITKYLCYIIHDIYLSLSLIKKKNSEKGAFTSDWRQSYQHKSRQANHGK